MEPRHLRQILTLLVILLVGYGVILALASGSGFPKAMSVDSHFPFLADKPVGEDGYYMLTVAWNIARGEGITYNFNQPTTGIQPLYTLIEAGSAWLIQQFGGDKWDFTRSVIVLGVGNLILFSYLIAKITISLQPANRTQDPFLYIIAFLISAFNFGLFRIFTYGLETGLYLILLALNVLITMRWQLSRAMSTWSALGFGALAGLTILARLDYGLIFGVFLLVGLFRKQLTIFWVAAASFAAVLVACPWFYYVFKITGSLIPSSGFAQSGVISSTSLGWRAWEIFRSLISHSIPWIYSRPSVILTWLAALVLAILAVLFFRSQEARHYAVSKFLHQRFNQNWLIAILTLLPIYLLVFKATYFYTRYLTPLQIILIPAISTMIVFTLKNADKKWRLGLFLLLPASFFLWSYITLHTGVVTNPQSVLAGYVQEHFSPDDRIGAFQSGVLGFFNPNVINLDGKMNQGALEALQIGQMDRYLDRENISILVDWPEVIQKKLPVQYIAQAWIPCDEPVPDGRSICLIRK